MTATDKHYRKFQNDPYALEYLLFGQLPAPLSHAFKKVLRAGHKGEALEDLQGARLALARIDPLNTILPGYAFQNVRLATSKSPTEVGDLLLEYHPTTSPVFSCALEMILYCTAPVSIKNAATTWDAYIKMTLTEITKMKESK